MSVRMFKNSSEEAYEDVLKGIYYSFFICEMRFLIANLLLIPSISKALSSGSFHFARIFHLPIGFDSIN